jgi:hypothetical protein
MPPPPGLVKSDIGKDMIRELIHVERVEEEGLPLVVVRRKIIEEDGDHHLGIEDGDGLSVKGGDRGICLSGDVCPEDIIIARIVYYAYRSHISDMRSIRSILAHGGQPIGP